ncbi:hypothetical protein F4779DRAFT_616310 [Xylariaceae sp. FL0662B]|nr:hypothetical protein F4779DRAFT_616310 [Xylariaceae sp. FL0662B]
MPSMRVDVPAAMGTTSDPPRSRQLAYLPREGDEYISPIAQSKDDEQPLIRTINPGPARKKRFREASFWDGEDCEDSEDGDNENVEIPSRLRFTKRAKTKSHWGAPEAYHQIPTRKRVPSAVKTPSESAVSNWEYQAADSEAEDDVQAHSMAEDFSKLSETAKDPRYAHLFPRKHLQQSQPSVSTPGLTENELRDEELKNKLPQKTPKWTLDDDFQKLADTRRDARYAYLFN